MGKDEQHDGVGEKVCGYFQRNRDRKAALVSLETKVGDFESSPLLWNTQNLHPSHIDTALFRIATCLT